MYFGYFLSNNACFMAAEVVMQCSHPVLMLIENWKGRNNLKGGITLSNTY